jgi:hypothetical protein
MVERERPPSPQPENAKPMLDESIAEIDLDHPGNARKSAAESAAPEPASGFCRRDLEGYSLETLSAILDP